MYFIEDNELFRALLVKALTVEKQDSAEPELNIVIKFVRLRFNPYTIVAESASTNIEDKVLSVDVNTVSDDHLKIADTVFCEVEDYNSFDNCKKFIEKMYQFFLKHKLHCLELREFDSRTLEFQSFMVSCQRIPREWNKYVSGFMPPARHVWYNSGLKMDIVLNDTVEEFMVNIGNRQYGDVRLLGENKIPEFFDKFTRLLVLYDTSSKALLEHIEKENADDTRMYSLVATRMDLNKYGLEKCEKFLAVMRRMKAAADFILVLPTKDTVHTNRVLKYLITSEVFKTVMVLDTNYSSQDIVELNYICSQCKTFMIGPSRCALISPGNFVLGKRMDFKSTKRSTVAVITRSESMMHHVVDIVQRKTHGLYEAIAIGTNESVGLACGISDQVYRFCSYDQVQLIIVIESSSDNRTFNNSVSELINFKLGGIINKPVITWFSSQYDNMALHDHGFIVPPSLELLELAVEEVYRSMMYHGDRLSRRSVNELEQQFSRIGLSIEECDDDGNLLPIALMKESLKEST